MPLEADWQRAELVRSVTLLIRRWPNNRLQRTALRAATVYPNSTTGRITS